MSSEKRILIISQYYPPDITAASFRVSETSDHLVKLGYHVTVLTARPHRGVARGEEGDPLPSGVRVIRAPIFVTGQLRGMTYVLHYLSFMITAIIWGLMRVTTRTDYVIATSPPLFVGVVGWVLACAKGADFVLDIRDLWPDSAAAVGQISPTGHLFRIGSALERFLYRRAKLITCVAQPMRDVLRQRVPKCTGVHVVYNGCEIGAVPDSEEDNGTGSLSQIVYIGNLGRAQGLDLLVEAAKVFPNISFELIGGGVMRDSLIAAIHASGLRNVRLREAVRKSDAFRLMCESDALFLHVLDSPTFEKTIPSKLFDYLAAGRPILYGIRGEGLDILRQLHGNIGFRPGDSDDLIRAIRALQICYDDARMASKANRAALEGFSREEMTLRLTELLNNLAC